MTLKTIPFTSFLIQQGLQSGLHIGAQLYASLNGRIVADAAWGLARDNVPINVPMQTDTLMLWLSSGKPIAAAAIGQLWERGRLDLDDRVVAYIPEFAVGGKQDVTIRHLLTHTAGFRGAAMNFSLDPWDTIIAQICATRLESGWIPGKKAGYHTAGSWLILGELIRRLDGRSFDQYVRDEIFLPLGMTDCWIGMPPRRYRDYGDRIGLMRDTSGAQPPHIYQSDTEAGCALCNPGVNGRGPARQLAFFYEVIVAKGTRQGKRILSPQTVEALTACHRRGMFDHTFGTVMDWGLGFISSNTIYGTETVPYSFGRHASPRTVGHGGRQSSVGLADPEHGLAAAIIFNGTCGEVKHAQRIRQATAALYEDLGLAAAPAPAPPPA